MSFSRMVCAFGNSYNLASDAVQGAYSVTLTSTPSPAINVGDMVVIDENTDNDPNVVWGPSFGGRRRWLTPVVQLADRAAA